MSYKKLEIWQIAREVVIEIHKMSLNKLPKFEMFEEGNQIRRSSKSVKSNIVEGYGRRRYKQDFIRFLIYALSSNDETIDHLETLFETDSLTDREAYLSLHEKINHLGRKLNNFISSVEKNHNTKIENQVSRIKYPVSSIQYLYIIQIRKKIIHTLKLNTKNKCYGTIRQNKQRHYGGNESPRESKIGSTPKY